MNTTPSAGEQGTEAVAHGRQLVRERAQQFGRSRCAEPAALVASELITNALLHGGGIRALDVRATPDGVRIEVRDRNRIAPRVGVRSEQSLTGHGLQLVAALATRWGAEAEDAGKAVWAEVTSKEVAELEQSGDQLLAWWDDDWHDDGQQRYRVDLGRVPTDLLVEAKTHVEGVVRELTLASQGARAGVTADIPPHLARLLSSVVEDFAEARLSIKQQALDAVRRGDSSTPLVLDLPAEAAEAAERYAAALDEVDAYCRARRLLTLETPPQHRVFRQWYVGEVTAQLRAAASGAPPPEPVPFERRLLAELDRVASAQRATDRAARLYTVAAALVSAATPRAVVDVVLTEGVAALGASGGGVLVAAAEDRLALEGSVGYDENTVQQLHDEHPDAELPAAEALRTGRPVWLESRVERDERFPQLAALEASTVSLCAVPLVVQGRRLGALRFSFAEPRLFDEDERRFVLALAAETTEALDRAQLQETMAALLAAEREAREALDREQQLVESFQEVGRAVTARLDIHQVVQQITDAATRLTGAAFGAFFYNAIDEHGERYQLYTLSGSPRAAFASFPLPRNTDIFAPTFRGEGVVRLDDVTTDPRYGRNPPHHGMPEGHLPVRSYLAVPVAGTDGEVIGALFFGHPEPGRFGADEESLVVGIGGYAAIAMENARLFEQAQRELKARETMLGERDAVLWTLEQPLIPPQVPVVPGLDIAALYRPYGTPLAVGGDFYDVFSVPGDAWAFVVGDVSGKGPHAAALTGLARPTCWAAGRATGDPARMLELLNDAILRAPTDRFCTAVTAIAHPRDHGAEVRVAVGGHPPPVILRADGTATRVDAQGTLLGVLADANFGEQVVHLEVDDAIVFYTDGVTEGGGPHSFDDQELLHVVSAQAGRPASVVADAIAAAAAERRPATRDDLAILVVRATGLAGPAAR